MAPILKTEHVTMRFGGLTALDDVGVEADAGSVTGLIGPNGAGKSTLFNCINGLLSPTRGRICVRERDVTHKSPQVRARLGMARTFQQLETFRSMSVYENLLVGAEARGGGNVALDMLRLPARRRHERDAEQRAAAILSELNLEPIADSSASELSLGQERIVELGRALCTDPQLLLLDEPSSGLDQRESETFGRLLEQLVSERGLGILLVEHDMSLVMAVCEKVFVLDFGRLIAAGQAEEIRRDPTVMSAYLGDDDEETSLKR